MTMTLLHLLYYPDPRRATNVRSTESRFSARFTQSIRYDAYVFSLGPVFTCSVWTIKHTCAVLRLAWLVPIGSSIVRCFCPPAIEPRRPVFALLSRVTVFHHVRTKPTQTSSEMTPKLRSHELDASIASERRLSKHALSKRRLASAAQDIPKPWCQRRHTAARAARQSRHRAFSVGGRMIETKNFVNEVVARPGVVVVRSGTKTERQLVMGKWKFDSSIQLSFISPKQWNC